MDSQSKPNIDNLMFRREHFPIERDYGIYSLVDTKESYFLSSTGGIPPYHPTMDKKGIDMDIAISVLDESLENTLKDFEIAGEKIPRFKRLADEMKKLAASGKPLHGEPIAYKNEHGDGRIMHPFPVAGTLCIENDRINTGHGDCHIIIHPNLKQTQFWFPIDAANLTKEIMEEYEMREGASTQVHRIVKCPYGWYSHNVWPELGILYKNLVITIDNEVVKRKYSRAQ